MRDLRVVYGSREENRVYGEMMIEWSGKDR